MSDDLISRKSLIENLNKFAPEHYNTLINDLIAKEPTAFDKEKVINEIRSGVMAANDEYIETCDEYYHGMHEAHKIDWKIVEKGGIE